MICEAELFELFLFTLLWINVLNITLGDEDGRVPNVWKNTRVLPREWTLFHIFRVSENELFSTYLECVQLFFLANGVDDEKKVPVFLSIMTYSLLRNLVAPVLPQSKTFYQLVAILKCHFEPKPVIIAKRFHFYRHSQAMGETIAEYLAELRCLSTHCSFGDFLEQALCDHLVCGIRSESLQKRLLAEAELTLKKAVKIAVGMEAAEKTTKSLKEEATPIQQISET